MSERGGRFEGPRFSYEAYEISHNPEKAPMHVEEEPVVRCETKTETKKRDMVSQIQLNCQRCHVHELFGTVGLEPEKELINAARHFLRSKCQKWKELGAGKMPDSFLPSSLQR